LVIKQIAPSTNSLRSQTQTLQYMLDQCVDIFGDGVYPRTDVSIAPSPFSFNSAEVVDADDQYDPM
jgi:hypothetical protein